MRVTEASNYTEYRNSIAFEYINFFEILGFMVILIPNNTQGIKQYFSLGIDLIVLSGGNNVNPKLYNNNNTLNDVYAVRDNLEKQLLEYAITNSIKTIGICRGMHFINIFFNGTLSHNIKNHVNTQHFLKSDLDILDNKETNSYHNQGIKTKNLANKFNILAITEDEIVEAILNDNKTILAIQWHPERQKKEYDKKLIINFIKGIL